MQRLRTQALELDCLESRSFSIVSSIPQFPYLWKEIKSSAYLTGLLWGLNETLLIKRLTHYLVNSIHAKNVSYYYYYCCCCCWISISSLNSNSPITVFFSSQTGPFTIPKHPFLQSCFHSACKKLSAPSIMILTIPGSPTRRPPLWGTTIGYRSSITHYIHPTWHLTLARFFLVSYRVLAQCTW